jgi:hypothetical protein
MVQGTAESGKGLVESNESATTADAGFHAYCESACFDETMGHRSESGYLSGRGTYAWDQTTIPLKLTSSNEFVEMRTYAGVAAMAH